MCSLHDHLQEDDKKEWILQFLASAIFEVAAKQEKCVSNLVIMERFAK